MPTMKDIAQKAGVSYGTVSNVLNKRGNVSLEKIKLVETVASELGYFLNTTAKSLRSSNNNEYTFIVPSLNIYKYRKLYNLLRRQLEKENIDLQLVVSDYSPIKEKKLVYKHASTSTIIIIISCSDNVEKTYSTMSFQNTKLIFVDSVFSHKSNASNLYSVTFDLIDVEQDLNRYIDKMKYQNVLIFSDNFLYKSISLTSPKHVTYAYSELYNDTISAIEHLKKNEYDLIISTSPEKFEAINNAKNILQLECETAFIIFVSNKMLFDNSHKYYYHDMNLYANQILQIASDKSTTYEYVIPNIGFLDQSNYTKLKNKIHILMIESPTTRAIQTINPYIEASTGLKVHIDVFKYNEYDKILDKDFISKYDMVRIDMAYLPEIGDKIFKPMKNIYDEIKERLVVQSDEYTKHNGIHYALPLDIGCQIMLYREDILNDQKVQREYFEKTKKQNIIPKSFEDYNSIEHFFHDNYSHKFFGSTVCNGSDLTRAGEFLARVKNTKILTPSNDLNIDNPEVLNALKSFLTSIRFSSKRDNRFWDQVIQEYAEGNTIMAITFSNYIHLLSELNKDIAYKTNYAVPPYHKSLIGGGILGLTTHTENEDSCRQYIKLLYSDRMGKLITYLGGTMPIKSIYNDISLISMYPWLNFIPQIIQNNSRKYIDSNGHILNTLDYEKRIGKELHKYLVYNLDMRD